MKCKQPTRVDSSSYIYSISAFINFKCFMCSLNAVFEYSSQRMNFSKTKGQNFVPQHPMDIVWATAALHTQASQRPQRFPKVWGPKLNIIQLQQLKLSPISLIEPHASQKPQQKYSKHGKNKNQCKKQHLPQSNLIISTVERTIKDHS